MSFFRSPWYLSGVIILVVVILISIFVIGVKDVFFFITTLVLFLIRLPVFCNSGCDDLLVVLNIKPGVYNLRGYGLGTCGLSF